MLLKPQAQPHTGVSGPDRPSAVWQLSQAQGCFLQEWGRSVAGKLSREKPEGNCPPGSVRNWAGVLGRAERSRRKHAPSLAELHGGMRSLPATRTQQKGQLATAGISPEARQWGGGPPSAHQPTRFAAPSPGSWDLGNRDHLDDSCRAEGHRKPSRLASALDPGHVRGEPEGGRGRSG